MRAINLKTAHLKSPLGIDVKRPLLSWNCAGGEKQSAYQIIAYTGENEIWNSGKVVTSRMQAFYEGPVKSRDHIIWKIMLWDENHEVGEINETGFEYALLEHKDWEAKWINPETVSFNPKERQSASVLVRTFTLDDVEPQKEKARLYATAHGIYVLYINGKRVTENILTPGTSEYRTRLPFQTFDVSEYLKKGENRLEVVLGDGWYRGCNGNMGTRNVFGTDIALLLQLEINNEIRLVSDENWLASQDSMVRLNDLQLGERVDARITPKDYHGVKIEEFGFDNLVCANTLPIKEKECFTAKLIHTPAGKTVLDFGQNMAGYVSFRLAAKAGQTIRMTHGEYIDKNGEFSDDNIQTRGRKEEPLHQVVEYICKEGMNEYTPTLCFFGFQYVLVETEIAINGDEFRAHAIYSDMEQTADFECDHPLVNRLFKNALWSQKSNFIDIPMDCPQRERSGWTGDAALYCRTGISLMDAYPVYARWLAECRECQYPDGKVANIAPRRSREPSRMDVIYDAASAWGDAAVIIPYTMYKMYEDKTILEENWEFMSRWMEFCKRKAKKTRLKNRFKKNPYRKYTMECGMEYGEWLEAGISMEQAMKDIICNGAPDVATAYYAQSAKMMSEIAKILDKPKETGYYEELYENANAAYHFAELPEGNIDSKRQCKYVRPLQMGLLTEEETQKAAADLNRLVADNQYFLNTGFLTTAHICGVLADNGYVETAYRLLLQEGTPGWLYQVKQGATTIWESWEGTTGSTGVSGLNHYSKGAVSSWLIEGVCGIRAYGQKVKLVPHPHPLMKYAKASLDAPCGRIESEFAYKDETIEYKVKIPPNVEAVFVSPDGRQQKLKCGENEICFKI